MYAYLTVLFVWDDALHKLLSLDASLTFLCFNNKILGKYLAPVKCILVYPAFHPSGIPLLPVVIV